MTNQHRATPEQWAFIDEHGMGPEIACLLELRNRVEALEKAQRPLSELNSEEVRERALSVGYETKEAAIRRAQPMSLVEKVAAIITNGAICDHEDGKIARAAIREVAAALIEWHDSDQLIRTAWEAGKWLEREANR